MRNKTEEHNLAFQATRKRFIKDVKHVLAGQWVASRNVIQEPGDVEKLNNVCTFWLDTATNRLKATQVEAIVTERYFSLMNTLK